MLNMAERINIVDGRFVDIDRDGQAIVLRDGSVVPYDYLVVTYVKIEAEFESVFFL